MVCIKQVISYEYYLSDIYHSGYSGIEYTRKEGEKYDKRRHHYCTLEPLLPQRNILHFIIYLYEDEDLLIPLQNTVTTPLVDIFEEAGYVYVRTVNSIYQLRIIRKLVSD